MRISDWSSDVCSSDLADSTIPVANTEPALDLTTLFNGFKPLFTALDPDQVNELSMNLVQVLQGEGGTVASLLENTASLTGTLAGRDDLIGEVITNLSKTRSEEHTSELQSLMRISYAVFCLKNNKVPNSDTKIE